MNLNRLTEPFSDSELEWKPQSVGIKNGQPWAMILCYVQARAIQTRLDEVFGPMNWRDEYRFEKNGVICRLSVYCKDKKEWITKENGHPETDIESFKGGISGAFKRVASSGYGIGRYLYELDTTFAECSMKKQNGYKAAKTKDNQYFYWKVPNGSDLTQLTKTEYKKVDKLKDSQDDLEKAKRAIHDLFKSHSPDQKRQILKKATFWPERNTYCDDINNLTTNGRNPSVAQLRVWYKKIQEIMLSQADFVSDEL